jgi:hypothetical protein
MLVKGGKDIVAVLVTVPLIELSGAWLTNMRESTRARETRLNDQIFTLTTLDGVQILFLLEHTGVY